MVNRSGLISTGALRLTVELQFNTVFKQSRMATIASLPCERDGRAPYEVNWRSN
jgi:hypothetical protein